ncbi:MAG: helix-turn-helix transcriptional regulator [Prevotella sp.]|nr:helix-turn-helix transcriptional regulator [Prevotella sp.]
MEKILAENVKRICKAQGKQMKDLAGEMGVDPASLTRAIYGNARLDTIEKIAFALGVSANSLLEPIDVVEGFIRIGGKIYQFNSQEELEAITNKVGLINNR